VESTNKSVESKKSKRIIISGGGTGGHIFPAIAIANALKALDPGTEILFVGALGRMEMEKVPAAGYRIIGLDIQGIQRKSILKNLKFPFKLIGSVRKAIQIIKDFKPDAAVGVGGYASGPLLYAASLKGVPYLIQEQNSYAGITNKWLGKKAQKICVAFDGMGKFFPADKIIKTGNPIRRDSVDIAGKHLQAIELMKLESGKKTILVTGGSLGARTLNNSILAAMDKILAADVQVIWQTGKFYYKQIMEKLGNDPHPNFRVMEFLNRMDLAYAAADVIISRAGAGTIAELCVVKKPVILVPSPNVAEDHQTKNALALVQDNAALFVADRDAEAKLVDTALELIKDKDRQKTLSENIGKLALPDADEVIAKEVMQITINN
jgi:UDP-N-acetylglucosamine--N-acetylmuramyl-(pentapeptide) pyrophosphoryl-undecaprenol N-acetylglucosamine transferase